MEAVMFNGSHPDQANSPCRSHIPCSKKTINPFVSTPSAQNFQLQKMGTLQPPPSFLSHSYSPFFSPQPPLPPLLPLPAANHHRHVTATRGQSCPPSNKRTNHNNRKINHSVTPKKSQPPNKNSVKPTGVLGNLHQTPSYSKNSTKPPMFSKNSAQLPHQTRLSGPDPDELPKDVKKLARSFSSGAITCIPTASANCISYKSSTTLKLEEDLVDMFSGSRFFTISPPPSSLPLPTFSLRPKLSCKAEATTTDSGATDSLRRLLQLT